jgi:hypothetical protein
MADLSAIFEIEVLMPFFLGRFEEAPYPFLYTTNVTLAYRNYLQNVFIPADRQDLIPGANVEESQSNTFELARIPSEIWMILRSPE